MGDPPPTTRYRTRSQRHPRLTLDKPTHTRGQVWYQQTGRRESDWFLRKLEEEDEVPQDDYRRAPRRAEEAWHEEREEMCWQIERLSRDMELLRARDVARAEEELTLHQEIEHLQAQRRTVTDSGNPRQGADSTSTQPPLLVGTPQQAVWPMDRPPQCRDLKARVNGKVESLPYLLVQVEVHMQCYGESYEDDTDQIHEVRACLEGDTVAWYTGLHELSSFPRFMSALRQRFEDPFQEERMKQKPQNLQQGTRSVVDFTSEFCQLAGQIRDWPEQVLIHFYKEALDPEIVQWGMMGGGPPTLAG
uniref:Uncharacterized protein n=1 Tax=Sphaerodactylus townsendi TaxID=933632 RepID=A0ACB8FTC5_9SAUR